jgi:phage-related holin
MFYAFFFSPSLLGANSEMYLMITIVGHAMNTVLAKTNIIQKLIISFVLVNDGGQES